MNIILNKDKINVITMIIILVITITQAIKISSKIIIQPLLTEIKIKTIIVDLKHTMIRILYSVNSKHLNISKVK